MYVYLHSQMVTRFWFAILVIALVGGFLGLQSCQSMPKPETPRQTIAYVQATLTGVINAAATARELGKLDNKQAAVFRTSAKEIEAYIDLANLALVEGDLSGMEANLTTVRKLLLLLNKMLLEMEGS